MLLLETANLKKFYGDRLLFELSELKIYSGDKIGIVGENGSGKTTLMEILTGNLTPDEGVVKTFCELSYVKQFSTPNEPVGKELAFEFGVKNKNECLSGGEQTRLKLAGGFGRNTPLLFADEPSCNLDSKGILLLIEKFRQLDSFVIISHDRFLLDSLCDIILAIHDRKIEKYYGNYTDYLVQKDKISKRSAQLYERYINEKSRLENAVAKTQSRSKSVRKTPKRMGNSEARLHRRESGKAEQKLNNSAKALESRLKHLEVPERLGEISKIKLDFSLTIPPENKVIAYGKNIFFQYDNNVIFEDAAFEIPNHTRTAIIGGNGVGKTTLLNLISNKHSEISVVPRAKIGYFRQDLTNLIPNETVINNALRDSVQSNTTVRTILAQLLFKGSDVHKKVSALSGGEKIKLSLAKLLLSDANILFLDEPTNFLDIQSIEVIQSLLNEYSGTLVLVSHDKEFVGAIANRLFVIENKKIITFDGGIQEYESQNNAGSKQENTALELSLRMKLAKISSDIAQKGSDSHLLEQKYQEILSQLSQLN